MKKLLSLGFALALLTSCSDDDSSSLDLTNLQKRWYNVSSIVNGKTIAYDGNEACGKDYLEFLANNTVREVDVYDCQEDPDVTTGTYSATEKTLTTTIDGETIVYTIKKLNAKDLQIQYVFSNLTVTDVYTSTP